ncbi:NACHT domain-containing protein [Nonomuraea angiospora]|uniref:NACHT N-terminal Helical domain-containing protein n=1 Tax=Nonomuraea angiospora TaxID=46172 RepID=A0ABR9MFU4_9ACTN|nr:hypothetical protein [Nonomuraea angiospora]MBE1591785.1 hypothetical protein [Nonomuraea angiospora]
MSKSITYADALRILGGESATIKALDKIVGGALLGAAAAGFSVALGLIDAKAEAVRLCHELVSNLRGKLSGLGRYTRTQRLEAAHAIIVLAAFLEAIDQVDLPFTAKQLDLSRREIVEIGNRSKSKDKVRDNILNAEVLVPEMHRSYEENLHIIRRHYVAVAASLTTFLRGLKIWEDLDETAQRHVPLRLIGELPDYACARYQELYRQLSLDCREFSIWADIGHHQATRDVIRTGLAELEHRLSDLVSGIAPAHQLLSITNANRAALDRPVNAARDLPEDLRIPKLSAAYVDPRFRVCEPGGGHAVSRRIRQVTESGTPADISSRVWWENVKVRKNLPQFLAGFLTSPRAVTAPLIVLGQPGSGKSVLMQILAARLPANQFLPICISMRSVPADAEPHMQIEAAVSQLTHENVHWANLARSAAHSGILPVLLFDGLDEAVQATGVHRSDFLEKVADFQRRERDQGRAVAAVVTTRAAVANWCRLPDGLLAVQLEPFDPEQISTWIETWNSVNENYFRGRALRPLLPEHVVSQRELASEPLLLLMLALYDADANGLQLDSGCIARTELYRRVLTRFVEREIAKKDSNLAAEAMEEAVDYELRRLAIVAIAMMNRRRQWVSRDEIDQDLQVWFPKDGRSPSTDFRASLSPAEKIIARFFFIHEAKAVQNGQPVATYEFLHATFAEYLVAFLFFNVLEQLRAEAAASARPFGDDRPQDGPLYALSSFALLSSRRAVLGFLKEMAGTTGAYDKLVTRLFQQRDNRTDHRFAEYLPNRLMTTKRSAYYEANLIVMSATTAEYVSVRELLGIGTDPIDEWQRHAHLVKHAALKEEWLNHLQLFRVSRTSEAAEDDVRVSIGELSLSSDPDSLNSTGAHDVAAKHEIERMEKRFLLDESLGLAGDRGENVGIPERGIVMRKEPLADCLENLLYGRTDVATGYRDLLRQLSMPDGHESAIDCVGSILRLLARDIPEIEPEVTATLIRRLIPLIKGERNADAIADCVSDLIARDTRQKSLVHDLVKVDPSPYARLRVAVILMELEIAATDVPWDELAVANVLTRMGLDRLRQADRRLFLNSRRVIMADGARYGLSWPADL